ncbi:MAG: hypothetical protein ACIAS6_08300 [Phycisphaerales bacterium JB060]
MADIVVQSLFPDTSVSYSTILVGTDPVTGAGRYVVNMNISMPSAAGRIIRVTSNSNDIIVRARITATGLGSVASVRFEGDWPTGQIESIEEIHYEPPLSGSPADISPTIRLHPTAGTGRVGGASSGCEIQFHGLTIEECRELTADLVRVPGQDPGNINLIDVMGNVTSDLIEGDIITEINVSGDIGAPGNLVRIDANTDLVTLRATNLYADLNIDGNVGQILVYGSSNEGEVEATDAVFGGTLDCDTMNDGLGLRIWGDLEANVNIADEMSGITARMFIGRELAGNVSFGAGGMGARGITIGWMPSATGIWSGDISVGSTTLSPKGDYTQTGLGGGAVGLVPYGLHKQDCDPKYEGSMWPTVAYEGDCDAPVILPQEETIDLVHYGAIENLIVAPEKPFEVTWAGGNHCSGPLCVHGANYTTDDWKLDATDPFPDPRTMRLTGLLYPNRHYHVVVDETLKCLNVFGSSTTIETKPYVYVIYMSACP